MLKYVNKLLVLNSLRVKLKIILDNFRVFLKTEQDKQSETV